MPQALPMTERGRGQAEKKPCMQPGTVRNKHKIRTEGKEPSTRSAIERERGRHTISHLYPLRACAAPEHSRPQHFWWHFAVGHGPLKRTPHTVHGSF
jgi:hypothetical protein